MNNYWDPDEKELIGWRVVTEVALWFENLLNLKK